MFLVSYVIGTDVHERVVGVRRVFKENIKGFSMKWRIIISWILFFYYYIFVKFKIDFLYIIKFRRHDFWNNRVPGVNKPACWLCRPTLLGSSVTWVLLRTQFSWVRTRVQLMGLNKDPTLLGHASGPTSIGSYHGPCWEQIWKNI
jgi:hypothetical protein